MDMLHEMADSHPHYCFYFEKQAKKLSDNIENVAGWRFLSWTEKSANPTHYHEGKAELILKTGEVASIFLDESNFYKLFVLGPEYRRSHFKLLKPGKLAYVAEQEAWLITPESLIMDSAQAHEAEGSKILEGEPVMVLETVCLDDVTLSKVLHGEIIRWTYACLYDKDWFDAHLNENHWI